MKGYPERLEMHIVYDCIQRCIFCSEATRIEEFGKGEVPFDRVMEVLVRGRRKGANHVNFTGGEPTLHSSFPDIIRASRGMGYRVYVGTNGSRLKDRDFALEILPFLDEVSFSIHGPCREVHDALTARAGSFKDVMEALENVRDYGKAGIYINCVILKENFPYLLDTLRLFSTLSPSMVTLSAMAPEGRGRGIFARSSVRFREWRALLALPEFLELADDVPVRIFGLPLCLFPHRPSLSNDLFFDPRVTVEKGHGPKKGHGEGPFLKEEHVSGPGRLRRKLRNCRPCIFKCLCGGVFEEYLAEVDPSPVEPVRSIP